MAVLPPERHPVLVVHADAVALGLPAFQTLKTVASRNHEVVKSSRSIQELEFPLSDTPEISGNPPRGPRVSLSEQVCGGLVRE
jgi:hypothetical protein